MRGYTGNGELFHSDYDCPALTGLLTGLSEERALKWGLEYCPVCMQQWAGDVTEARRAHDV